MRYENKRFVIKEKGFHLSEIISVNGAAAHKANPGDLVIIATYASYNELELARYAPELVYVDADNRIMDTRQAIPVQAA